MNLRYRINQVINSLNPPRGNSFNWILIHGLPRSGTTFFYHQYLSKSKLGVSDWDLCAFKEAYSHIEKNDRISIDLSKLTSHLRMQILQSAPPGGGSSFDLIVKQVNMSKWEFDLWCELLGGAPRKMYFLYREPTTWMASAMKKFGYTQSEAHDLYLKCLEFYQVIGGIAVDYEQNLTKTLDEAGIQLLQPFNVRAQPRPDLAMEDLDKAYKAFHSFYSPNNDKG